MNTYVADKRRHFDTGIVALSDNNSSGLFDPSLALKHDILLAGIWVVLSRASGILKRREFVLPADFNAGKLLKWDQGEHIKDELFQFDAVGLLGLHRVATLEVDARNLLACNVMRKLVSPRFNGFQKSEGVVVIDNVGSTELEHFGVFRVLGFGCFLVDLGVFHNIRPAVLLQNQSHRFCSIAFPDDLSGDINVLGGCKANEYGVGNLGETVVDTVGVNVLNAPLSHILTHARCNECLVNTTVTIRCNGDLCV